MTPLSELLRVMRKKALLSQEDFAKALASNMCSKVLNGHIILTDTSITTILAPEMTYTPILFPESIF